MPAKTFGYSIVTLIATIASALFPCETYAQASKGKGVKIGGGADLVSSYVCRGVDQAGASFQPTLTLTAVNFTASAWGSADFASTSYKKIYLTAAYGAYVEASYGFTDGTVHMKSVPRNAFGTYGTNKDFYVQNVFVNGAKTWNIG